MENIKSVTSEEELLHLRNEGKISENEYEQLLEAMRKPTKLDVGTALKEELKPVRTSGLAVASLVFSLVGPLGSLPAIVCGHLALRKIKKEPSLRGYGLGLAGLIIGYAALGLFLVITIPIILPWTLSRTVAPPQYTTQVLKPTELKRFPLDDTEGIITQSGIQIDKQVSSDGNGSIRIEATEPTTIRLFETGDIDLEDSHLIYRARVRTKDLKGKAYLEMWCHFPGKGEFFSRYLPPVTGTTSWTTQEITFGLRKDENPDNVKLNIVIDGKGTVWIDDIRLSAFK